MRCGLCLLRELSLLLCIFLRMLIFFIRLAFITNKTIIVSHKAPVYPRLYRQSTTPLPPQPNKIQHIISIEIEILCRIVCILPRMLFTSPASYNHPQSPILPNPFSLSRSFRHRIWKVHPNSITVPCLCQILFRETQQTRYKLRHGLPSQPTAFCPSVSVLVTGGQQAAMVFTQQWGTIWEATWGHGGWQGLCGWLLPISKWNLSARFFWTDFSRPQGPRPRGSRGGPQTHPREDRWASGPHFWARGPNKAHVAHARPQTNKST